MEKIRLGGKMSWSVGWRGSCKGRDIFVWNKPFLSPLKVGGYNFCNCKGILSLLINYPNFL